jgi:hypothetical protein
MIEWERSPECTLTAVRDLSVLIVSPRHSTGVVTPGPVRLCAAVKHSALIKPQRTQIGTLESEVSEKWGLASMGGAYGERGYGGWESCDRLAVVEAWQHLKLGRGARVNGIAVARRKDGIELIVA